MSDEQCPSPVVRHVRIQSIVVDERRRTLNLEAVERLFESMKELGSGSRFGEP